MRERRRATPWTHGARLPAPVEPLVPEEEQLADPAAGELVPRCQHCGLPSSPSNQVLAGVWTRASFRMVVRLCERSILEFAARDPAASDPLTLPETGT